MFLFVNEWGGTMKKKLFSVMMAVLMFTGCDLLGKLTLDDFLGVSSDEVSSNAELQLIEFRYNNLPLQLEPEFSNTNYEYQLKIPDTLTQLDFIASPLSPKATFEYTISGETSDNYIKFNSDQVVSLSYSTTNFNKLIIKVISGNTLNVKIYKFELKRNIIVQFDSGSADVSAVPYSMSIDNSGDSLGELPSEPIKNGYSFGGWWTEPEGAGSQFFDDTPIYGSMTLYASWLINGYKVIYNGNGSTSGVIDSILLDYGSEFEVISNENGYEKIGHRFVCWNTKPDGMGVDYYPGNLITMSSNDFELYAKWEINSYDIVYNGNGQTYGTVPDSTQHPFGSIVYVADNYGQLSKTRFIFAGWNTSADGSGDNYTAGSGSFIMPDNTVMLYARWTDLPLYNVDFISDGVHIYTASVVNGDPLENFVPIKENHSFLGWYKDSYLIYPWDFANDKVYQNETLYAKWVSTNNKLQSIELNAGLYLSETFNPDYINYTVEADGSFTYISVNPTAEDIKSVISIQMNSGSFVNTASGYFHSPFILDAPDGVNAIIIRVTSESGSIRDYKITVNKSYFVSVSAGTGGTVTPLITSENRMPGTVINLSAVPNPGYRFLEWNGSGVAEINQPSTTLTVANQDVSVTAYFTPDFYSGDGSATTPFLVQTAAHLDNVRYFSDKQFFQIMNIDLGVSPYNTGTGWVPIGNNSTPFTGVYNGNNYNISKLMISRPTDDLQGLFGDISVAQILNVKLQNPVVTGKKDVGALVGRITNTTTGLDEFSPAVKNCHAYNVTISGAENVGGLIGSNNSTSMATKVSLISNSSVVQGSINGTGSYIGGLVGYNYFYAKILQCFAYNLTVDGGSSVGGLAGCSAYPGIVEQSYAFITVSGTDNVGGLVGLATPEGKIRNSYAVGTVSGYQNVGGLVGVSDPSSVESSYSACSVSGNISVGGLIGSGGTLTPSFYDKDASGRSDSGKGTPLSTSMMTKSTQFTDFDFATIWKIVEDISYPHLQWQGSINRPDPLSFSVTYNGLGSTSGSVPAGTTNYFYNNPVTVLGNTGGLVTSLTQDGITLVFKGWNTKSDGMGIPYKGGDTFNMPPASVILYAQWGVIGAVGPGGGLVFHDKGNTINGWRYLEAAPTDLSSSMWGNADSTINPDGSIGKGKPTSSRLYSLFGTANSYSARLCEEYNNNGFSDWFLPSIEELGAIFNNLKSKGLGGFENSYYWSSTDYDSSKAKYNYFNDGSVGTEMKSAQAAIRPVRAFREWSKATYVIIYHGNGSTGGSLPFDNNYYQTGELPTAAMKGSLEKLGAIFTGWNTLQFGSGTPYSENQTINIGSENVVLYAQWDSSFAGGDGTAGNPYLISTSTQLNNVRNHLDKHFRLINNIDLISYATGDGWMPIGSGMGPFTGSFDGAGFTIDKLTIYRTGQNDVGLFGYTQGASLKQIRLINVSVTGATQTGALVGYADIGTVINNCSVVGGSINSDGMSIGGIVGLITGAGSSINQSFTQGMSITTSLYSVGGLVGYLQNSATIANSYSTSTVSTSNLGKAGGIAGFANSGTTIDKCYAASVVIGTVDVGGIIGAVSACTITNSYYDMNVFTPTNAYGVAKNTSDMKLQATFSGFVFDPSNWIINNGDSYPYLAWQSGVDIPMPTVITYNINDPGPAGGKIFYINHDWQVDGWTYLEVAPQSAEMTALWSNTSVNTGAIGTSIKDGKNNTINILGIQFGEPDIAAVKCDLLNFGGYNDWFLPSVDQLTEIKNILGQSDFLPENYWSSTELNLDSAYFVNMNYGTQGTYQKSTASLRVRPVRQF